MYFKRRNQMNRRSLFVVVAALGIAAGLSSVVSTSSAQAPEIAKLPEGMVAIHYHRPAGDYKGWGLHVWKSSEKIADGRPVAGSDTEGHKPLVGVTWAEPMQPTGKDGFGIYWHLKADEFKNGKVNYIIHLANEKNCPSDLYFMSTQTKEIFVNQGECKYFTSAEEASKARR
jgi:hypothetical protein